MIKESLLNPTDVAYRETVMAGDYWMKVVKAGQTIRIVDSEGNQAADTNNAQASHAGIDDDPTLFDPPPTLSPHAQHLPALMRLVWRAVLLWGGLIALVTITNWVS